MRFPALVGALLAAACNAGSGGDTGGAIGDAPAGAGAEEAWRLELEEWKSERDRGLRRPTGWLSLAGLYWLAEGSHVFGSDPAGDLVFPAPAPARMGVLHRRGREVRLQAEPGVELIVDGHPAASAPLVSEAGGEPTLVEHGTLSFYVIERGDRVGVRLKDSASELLATFAGMEYYPPDPAWRVEAEFEHYDEPKTVAVPNIIGDTLESSSPGVAVFEVGGREYRLEPTSDPADELFFVFGDETNGEETYGGGRFLYAGPPAADGSIVLDFNRAYNPPCVFTPYATCPLPRPEDRLALAVEAGEKTFGAPH